MSDSSPPVEDSDGAPASGTEDDDGRARRLFDSVIPEVVRRVVERAVESGVEKLTEGPENIRNKVADIKLPKEVATYLYHQIDDTKKGVYRVVAKEIRDVLEHTNLSDEIADVLTKLQFEITTHVRFVPNTITEENGEPPQPGDAAGASDKRRRRSTPIPRPQVVSKVAVKPVTPRKRKPSSDDPH